MTANVRNRGLLAFGAAFVGLFPFAYYTNTAQAQSTNVFCPDINAALAVSGAPTTLSAGLCTNGTHGAENIAALSSQALSEVSQSSTQLSNTATVEAILERRREEAERCPEGFERVEGTCRKIVTAPSSYMPVLENGYPALAPWRQPNQTATLGGEAPVAPAAPMAYTAAPMYKAPPIVDTGIRPAIWAHGFGDFQQQTTAFVAPGPTAGAQGSGVALAAGVPPTPMYVTLDSKTSIWGFMSGADLTFRNVAVGGDVLITGLLGGYLTSDMNLNTISTSSNLNTALGGSSATKIHLSGPSVGAYGTYFTGPFSTDLTFRADFLNINESFVDDSNFLVNNGNGALVPAPTVVTAGTLTASVTDLSIIQNFNYRFPIYAGIWIEPTVGLNYTYSLYDAAAASLGLSDGYVLLVQGGARLGIDNFWGPIHVTQTITGLAYDDVKVVGGPILNAAFIGGPLLNANEGKIRGEGIYAMNFDYGNGFSSFVEGVAYGGEDLIGAGGKVGLRYQW
jgi:Autotransporter beta-domain